VNGVEQPTLAKPLSLNRNPISPYPGMESPGVFFDSRRPSPSALSQATESLRRKTMDKDKGSDEFHDSEIDVFDLFNSVNGEMRDGLLDIGKLEEFTDEEANALNVPRLREIWEHTTSGCLECKRIITMLTALRKTVREEMEESFQAVLPIRR
jgi:hypothetical protein